jgi:hypothetical protein
VGPFAETAIVDYHLPFADQENKPSVLISVSTEETEVCCFRFPVAANKQEFSVCIYIYIQKIYIYIYICCIYAAVLNGNGSPGDFP